MHHSRAYIVNMESIHFKEDGHLTKEGISWYVEYLLEMEGAATSQKANESALKEQVLEHVKQCTDCHQEAIGLYRILAEIPSSIAITDDAPPKSKPIPWRFFLILLLIPLAYSLWRQQIDSVTEEKTAPVEEIAPPMGDSTQQRPIAIIDTLQEEKPPAKETSTAQKSDAPNLYAANFVPVEHLEAFAGEAVRADQLTVVKPTNDTHFKRNQQIIFEWNAKESLPLELILLNNREEILLQSNPETTQFSLNQQLEPGLYYWKLETPTALVFLGKFWVDVK